MSDEQIAFLNEVAKSYNKENIVIKIDVTDIDKVKITSDWSKKIIVALRNT